MNVSILTWLIHTSISIHYHFKQSSARCSLTSLAPMQSLTFPRQSTDVYIFDVVCIDDIMERIMDERTASDSKQLKGHSGPVYATSFSPDRNFLLSSSQDGTGKFIILFQFVLVYQILIIHCNQSGNIIIISLTSIFFQLIKGMDGCFPVQH